MPLIALKCVFCSVTPTTPEYARDGLGNGRALVLVQGTELSHLATAPAPGELRRLNQPQRSPSNGAEKIHPGN
jgi:hypothetical protein